MRWFTSDTHFGHERIIELCSRPFANSHIMDEQIIERWNSVVSPGDTVFHLGDVALKDIVAGLECVKRLNGFIHLVPGNHDRIFSLEKHGRRERFAPLYYDAFDSVLPEAIHLTLLDGREVEVSHFPYVGDSHDADRFDSVRLKDEGLPIIHGHVHEKWKMNGKQLNVGVDVWDFYPVSEDDVINLLEEAL